MDFQSDDRLVLERAATGASGVVAMFPIIVARQSLRLSMSLTALPVSQGSKV